MAARAELRLQQKLLLEATYQQYSAGTGFGHKLGFLILLLPSSQDFLNTYLTEDAERLPRIRNSKARSITVLVSNLPWSCLHVQVMLLV